jgi:hypothetical protein
MYACHGFEQGAYTETFLQTLAPRSILLQLHGV